MPAGSPAHPSGPAAAAVGTAHSLTSPRSVSTRTRLPGGSSARGEAPDSTPSVQATTVGGSSRSARCASRAARAARIASGAARVHVERGEGRDDRGVTGGDGAPRGRGVGGGHSVRRRQPGKGHQTPMGSRPEAVPVAVGSLVRGRRSARGARLVSGGGVGERGLAGEGRLQAGAGGGAFEARVGAGDLAGARVGGPAVAPRAESGWAPRPEIRCVSGAGTCLERAERRRLAEAATWELLVRGRVTAALPTVRGHRPLACTNVTLVTIACPCGSCSPRRPRTTARRFREESTPLLHSR